MKKFKKLIPALCMLLISAVLMGTSTYAWFSMNETVTATGMDVTAKSNSTYLLIGTQDNAAAIQKATSISATVTSASKSVYPAIYNKTADTAMTGTFVDGEGKPATAPKLDADSWYTANNTKFNGSTDAILSSSVRKLTNTDEFVVEYKLYLTLSADSANVTRKVKVSFARGDSSDASISAVVKVGSNTGLVFDTTTSSSDMTQTTDSTITLSKDRCVEVTVTVFVDGRGTNINSNYVTGDHAVTITGSVELTLTLA